MRIRKATRKDLLLIGKLMKAELSKTPFNEKDPIKNVVKSLDFYNKNAEIYLAIENKEIFGITIFQIEQWWEGPVIIIQDLVVKKEFQKHNIGKSLMNFIEKYAKKNKVKKIYFETNRKSSAISFYKKLGYNINKDRLSMSKKLK